MHTSVHLLRRGVRLREPTALVHPSRRLPSLRLLEVSACLPPAFFTPLPQRPGGAAEGAAPDSPPAPVPAEQREWAQLEVDCMAEALEWLFVSVPHSPECGPSVHWGLWTGGAGQRGDATHAVVAHPVREAGQRVVGAVLRHRGTRPPLLVDVPRGGHGSDSSDSGSDSEFASSDASG